MALSSWSVEEDPLVRVRGTQIPLFDELTVRNLLNYHEFRVFLMLSTIIIEPLVKRSKRLPLGQVGHGRLVVVLRSAGLLPFFQHLLQLIDCED